MNERKIDILCDIDIDKLTFHEIEWQYGTFNTVSHGSGRNKTYTSRSGVMTPIGDIEESIWCSLAMKLIEKYGETDLFYELLEFEKTHNRFVHCGGWCKKLLWTETLSGHVNRLFDHPTWLDFLEFNRLYRPEIAASTPTVYVLMECCEGFTEIPKVQIDGQSCFCPQCKRYARIKAIREKVGPA